MRSAFLSDRGLLYVLACYAVAYGIVLGAGVIPLLYAFGTLAGMLFVFLSAYIWVEAAVILAAIGYYIGVFLAATFATLIYVPIVNAVDYVFSGAWLPSITLPEIKLPSVNWNS